jgi:hypothetical protein
MNNDGEKLGDVSWLQPMMEALGMNPGTPQSFVGCPVALMPEERELPGDVRDRRILLNFPITLETLEIQRKLGQGEEVAPSQNADGGITGNRPRGIASAFAARPSTATRTAHRRSQKTLAQQRNRRQSRRPQSDSKASPPMLKGKSLFGFTTITRHRR